MAPGRTTAIASVVLLFCLIAAGLIIASPRLAPSVVTGEPGPGPKPAVTKRIQNLSCGPFDLVFEPMEGLQERDFYPSGARRAMSAGPTFRGAQFRAYEREDENRVEIERRIQGETEWELVEEFRIPRYQVDDGRIWSRVRWAVTRETEPPRLGVGNGKVFTAVYEFDDRGGWTRLKAPRQAPPFFGQPMVGPFEKGSCAMPCLGLENDVVRWGIPPESKVVETVSIPDQAPCAAVRSTPDEPWRRIETSDVMVMRACWRLDDHRVLVWGGFVDKILPDFGSQADIIDLSTGAYRTIEVEAPLSYEDIELPGPMLGWISRTAFSYFDPMTEEITSCDLPNVGFEITAAEHRDDHVLLFAKTNRSRNYWGRAVRVSVSQREE